MGGSWFCVVLSLVTGLLAGCFWGWRTRQLAREFRGTVLELQVNLGTAYQEVHTEQQRRLKERRMRVAAELRVQALLRELHDIDTDDEVPIEEDPMQMIALVTIAKVPDDLSDDEVEDLGIQLEDKIADIVDAVLSGFPSCVNTEVRVTSESHPDPVE